MNHNQAAISGHEEVAQVLCSDPVNGLTAFEAKERLRKYGLNNLDDDQPKDGQGHTMNYFMKLMNKNFIKYLSQFMNPLIQLLLLCVLVSVSIGQYENAVSVLLSVLIVGTISYIQERRADKSLEKLNKQMPSKCKVVRDRQLHEIEAQLLVPGDIVYLSEGQRVPADLRLYDVHAISINEANLTGEAISQHKTDQKCHEKQIESLLLNQNSLTNHNNNNRGDDKNFIFNNLALMGTLVESGYCRGIVISTGKATRYGEVYCLLKSTIQPKSPLQVNIDQLSIHLVIFSCTVIALMSILGVVQQRSALEVAYYAVSLAVTAIPEGLPVVVAVIMALGVLRLSKRQTIVKSLNSIETLGCIEVLCADKTGTLTRSEMTLTDIVTSELHSLSNKDMEEFNRDEVRNQMTFNKLGGKMYSIGRLMEVGTLCNNASYDPNPPEGLGNFIGQSTECAILAAAIKMGCGDSRTMFDRLDEVPFDPVNRRMAVQCRRQDLPGSGPMYYVKGAWEKILNDCHCYYDSGLVKPRTDEMWLEYARVCTALGSQGLRVLALATGPSMDQLTFVGIVGINNAPKDGMVETISKLKHEFLIDVKMITGDSRSTAVAVGRRLGLVDVLTDMEEDRVIMSGEHLRVLLASDMDELAKAHEISSKSIFYRVDPIQKASIVRKLQQLDKIIAMTGDGVNDVISMKQANLSMAMGSGADVCKEIADMVLVDDDLTVLVEAIVEGKGIYHKIHSFMSYQISISFTLLTLVAVSFLLRIASPYTVIQLLFINILTDGPPAQALGVERIEQKELNRKPRNVHEPILNRHLLGSLILLSISLITVNGFLYSVMLDDTGKLDGRARCTLFTCYVFCSVFATLSLRSRVKTVFEIKLFGNLELLYCSVVVVAIQLIIINVKPLCVLFDIEQIPVAEIGYIALYSSTILMIMDSAKVIMRIFHKIRSKISKRNPPQPAINSTDSKDSLKDIP